MKNLSRLFVLAILTVAGMLLVPSMLRAQEDQTLSQENVIAGTMDIVFNTRTQLDNSGDLKKGSPALGAKDVYKFQIAVVNTTEFSGQIERQPTLYSSILQRTKQNAALGFNINLGVVNPNNKAQKKTVGKWVGLVPIDVANGAFVLDGGKASEIDRPLRIAIDAVGKASAFADDFQGQLIGKTEKKDGLAGYTYKRFVGKKEISITLKRSDPMSFQNIKLGKGPAEIYPATYVNGRLDYDYETGNYLTDGIRFKYTLNGKDYEDIITGSIKWVEDADRGSNGKGHYEFNLRFNEEKNKTPTGESAAFEEMSAEDAFFAVDTSVPSLTGNISYVDTIPSGSELPTSSKVTYNLHANKLTKQQVMNFFKLWVLAVGPTNDE